jgi:dTDP-glucose 4,6-dehydratase
MECLLVTGGCGFIGSNFIHHLVEQSDFTGRIINVDSLTYAGNPENLADIETAYPDRYVFRKADICDPGEMEEIFEQYPIDAICHFAAESHVDRSIASPEVFIRTNIIGTYNLLEQARACQDRIVLFHHVSTDEVFGSLDAGGYFSETTPYDPSSPYSASKASSDHLVRAYHRTYGLPVTLSNCSNNYGPYHFPEKLIPLMILNAIEGKPLPVYGDGQNVRDWLYVQDHCEAIWTIMKGGTRGEVYTVGGRCEMTNTDVIGMICDILDEQVPMPGTGSRRDQIVFVPDRPGHDRRYAIDCTKLETELGWAPRESFDTGIRRTIDWYIQNKGWVDRVRSGEYLTWVETHYDL